MIGQKWPGIVIAVNEAAAYYPGEVHYLVSYHQEKLIEVPEMRRAMGKEVTFLACAVGTNKFDLEVQPWGGGSSAMIGVKLAHDLQVPAGILCGVPMTKSPHFHNRDAGEPWPYADDFWQRWENLENRMRPWLRSMSGRTAELLGLANYEWLVGRLEEVIMVKRPASHEEDVNG